ASGAQWPAVAFLDRKTPTSVPTTTWWPCNATVNTGTLGRLAEMFVKCAPASTDLNTWPTPTRLLRSRYEWGGTHCLLVYPPRVTYTIFGSFGSMATDVM